MFNLSRYRSLQGLLCIVLAAVVLCATYRYFTIQQLKIFGQQQHIQLFESVSSTTDIPFNLLSQASLLGDDSVPTFLNTQGIIHSLSQELRNKRQSLPIVKLILLDLDGNILYSTHEAEIDHAESIKLVIQSVAVNNKPITNLIYNNTFNAMDGKITNRYLLSSYLPFFSTATKNINGVVKIYTDVTEAYEQISKNLNVVFMMTIVTLFIFYIALFMMNRYRQNFTTRQDGKTGEQLLEIENINNALSRSSEQLAIARDQAHIANQTKGHFLANMSHEIRTPLAAIIGYSEMIKEELTDSHQHKLIPDIQKVIQQGQVLNQLIGDVIDISKSDTGKLGITVESVNVHELVEKIIKIIKPLMDKSENSFSFHYTSTLQLMQTDGVKLRQMLINLLSNANKFTSKGKVSLDVTMDTIDGVDWAEFKVKDSGIGIPHDQLDCIFEPFVRGDASMLSRYGGTGLGLTLCQRFSDLMGGSISVISQVGQGSEFRLVLPAQVYALNDELKKDEELPCPPNVRFSSIAQSGIERRSNIATVLVIDDEFHARRLMQRFLHKMGFRPILAKNGEEGLDFAKSLRPDLIALDVVMPGMDGWTVLQLLKNDPDLASIPVIMATMVEDESLAYSLGATEIIHKPINWSRFAMVIKTCVRQCNKKTNEEIVEYEIENGS